MTSFLALHCMPCATARGRVRATGRGHASFANNNRNNASLPRAGD